MNILAIETSSSACSVGLAFQGELKLLHKIAPMQQAQLLLPMIDELAHGKLSQLQAIAFGCGPGSFTGIRIATSVAQGLGYALNIPLIPISSLAALAQAAYIERGWKKIWVAVDARIHETYCGKYQINSNGLAERVGEEQVCAPENIAGLPQNSLLTDWQGAGNAWEIYSDRFRIKPETIDSTCLPTAEAILQLAKPLFESQSWVSPEEALPVYLRDEVAVKTNKR